MYQKYFELSGKPFQLNPDPDFFFGSRGHKRAMAYLEYGLHQAEGFIVITGEVGAGKTTLLRGLLRKLDSLIVAAQISSTQVDADDLIRLVAAEFGLDTSAGNKAALLGILRSHFEALHRAGKRALLVVDEAQNLSPKAVEELRMLSNFTIGTHSLVQSFLVGQPELREIMQRREMQQLKQRVIASYHLGPLERQETREYIEHRLRHVGWRDNPRFDDAAFDRVFRFSGGVPRRINGLCDRLLLDSYLAQRHAIGPADVENVASEMNDELNGGGAGLPTPPAAALPAGPGLNGHAAPQITHPGLLDRRLEQMDDRLARLEKQSESMIRVLDQILHPVLPDSARAKPLS